MDVVNGHELGQAFPDFVIRYYEKCAPFSVRHPEGKIRRAAPEVNLHICIIYVHHSQCLTKLPSYRLFDTTTVEKIVKSNPGEWLCKTL